MLPLFINELLRFDLDNLIVILDLKSLSEKDKKIWKERTNGILDSKENLKCVYNNFNYHKIPYYFVTNHNDKLTLDLINHLSLSVLLNGGTPRKLNGNILNSVKYGVVNIHPGILPKYAGSCAVEWAILNDDKVGNTAHFMSEGYDEGPIIKKESYDCRGLNSYSSIRNKVFKEGFILAAKVLTKIKTNKFSKNDAIPQTLQFRQFWSPMSDKDLKRVISKVENKHYLYQKISNV